MNIVYLVALLVSAIIMVHIWNIVSDKCSLINRNGRIIHRIFSLICFLATAIAMVIQEPILLIFAIGIFLQWVILTT